jgi:hypothetical protein
MLLWIPQDIKHNNGDDDEKSAKVQRQARLRAFKTTLACFGSSIMVLVVMLLQLRSYSSSELNLRRRRLPNNSIYSLSVLDSQNHLTSLNRFVGMVTLVVNTACL